MIAEISAALGSIKTAFDLLKLVQDSKKAVSELELQRKLVEIAKALADAEMQIASIQSQLAEKDRSIRKLQDKLEKKKHMLWEKPYYWIIKELGREGPFYPRCWDVDIKQVHLKDNYNGTHSCANCNNTYSDSRRHSQVSKET